jgi:hypothetical protein
MPFHLRPRPERSILAQLVAKDRVIGCARAPAMRFRPAVSAVLLALIASSCANRIEHDEIVIVPPDGGTSGDGRISTYAPALTSVLDALEQELALPRLDVSLVLFPSRRAFEQGLLESGYTTALARSASSFNAIGGARAVLINADSADGLTRAERIRLVAHEVTHTLQYQLGGGTRGTSEQWLREGFAEWVACRITARLGLASFASLRSDLVGQLGVARLGLPHAPFDKLATFPQWVDAQHRYEAPLYAQAFLAAELLVELRGVPAMLRYFEFFRDVQDRRRAFIDAFGLEAAAFERAFVRRWQESIARARMQH